MNCRDAQSLASNYLDGELPEEMGARIQRHLLRCAACRDEVESLRTAVQLLAATHAPPTLTEAGVRVALASLARELEIDRRTPETPGQLVLAGITQSRHGEQR